MFNLLKRFFGGGPAGDGGGETSGQLLELTPAAAAEMKMLGTQEGLSSGWALRVSIKETPEAVDGWMYTQDMVEEPPRPDETVCVSRGIKIYVDAWSRPYLQGTTIDLLVTPQGKGFVFRNPNTKAGR